ncbi:unnamed protein product [Rotaria sp. Silwood1]
MDKLSKSLEFLKLLSTTSETLIIKLIIRFFCVYHFIFISYTCNENDYDNLKEPKLTRIQVELHRIIKRSPNVGSRGALKDYFFLLDLNL